MNDTARVIAGAIYDLERTIRSLGEELDRTAWTCRMHPDTLALIVADIGHSGVVFGDTQTVSGVTLLGVPVDLDPGMLFGSFELRWSRLYMIDGVGGSQQ